MRHVEAGAVAFGNDLPLVVIAGPCQLETRDHAEAIAGRMAEICSRHGAGYVFKGSYDKANRTSLGGRRGPGMEEGLAILADMRAAGVPVLTDVHGPEQCGPVAEVADVIQIPAFLSAARRTCCWPRGARAPRSTSRRASSWRPGTWPSSPRRSPPPATSASC